MPNLSTQGIAALANTLESNGGTIRSTVTQANASLSGARDWAATQPRRWSGGGVLAAILEVFSENHSSV